MIQGAAQYPLATLPSEIYRMRPDNTALRFRATVAQLATLCAMFAAPAIADGEHLWPADARTAISLNYDDALDSQLDNALPALNRLGLKASFYLTLASPVVTARLAEWRTAARSGHELGNHTLFHHCRSSLPNRQWVKPHQDLDRRNPQQMREEILTANAFLHAIDGQTRRTFTPPCGDTQAGGEDYLALITPQFLAIKGAEPGHLRAVWLAPENSSGPELIALVERHARHSKLINLTFHGVGGDYLAISRAAHDALLAYLAAHPERYHLATYRALAMQFNRP